MVSGMLTRAPDRTRGESNATAISNAGIRMMLPAEMSGSCVATLMFATGTWMCALMDTIGDGKATTTPAAGTATLPPDATAGGTTSTAMLFDGTKMFAPPLVRRRADIAAVARARKPSKACYPYV